LVEELLSQGHQVVATARKLSDIEDLGSKGAKVFALDVTSEENCIAAVEFALSEYGRIDVLVNNAGYGTIGAVEEVSDAEVRKMFDVNVFGLLNMTRATLPVMREQQSGHLLHLSSLAGSVAYPGSATYGATKHAVEAINEGLAKELAPIGIKSTSIGPGPFRTDFAGRSLVLAEKRISDYDETAGKRRESIPANSGKQVGDPLKAVRAMIAVTELPEPPLRLPMGEMAYEEIEVKMNRILAENLRFQSLGRPTDYENE
jgi:NADP-dependent 3-hydroxy acid dehydrogenase YdfG